MKVSVNVSTFILVIIIIDRREVRDEYPSFFFVPIGIGILYPCAACHDLYQEGWQQFSCIMVLMMYISCKLWKVSSSICSFFIFSSYDINPMILAREKEGNMS